MKLTAILGISGEMAMKSLGLAAIALNCSVGIAVAQDTAARPAAPPRPQQERLLKALVERHAATAKTAGAAATGSTAASLGWNFAHATNCGWLQDSLGNQFFYIFPQEGGVISSVNNLHMSQGLQVPCGEGFVIGWHVVDAATGAFDQTMSFDFK